MDRPELNFLGPQVSSKAPLTVPHKWQSVGPVDQCIRCGTIHCLFSGSQLYRYYLPSGEENDISDWQKDEPPCVSAKS